MTVTGNTTDPTLGWPAPRTLDWRAIDPPRRSLVGLARVQHPSGLIVNDVAIHQAGSKAWAGPPCRPMIDRDGAVMRDDEGKVKYVPVISFQTRRAPNWSRQIVAAVREAHSEAFDSEDAA
jgi:hypothetical protein